MAAPSSTPAAAADSPQANLPGAGDYIEVDTQIDNESDSTFSDAYAKASWVSQASGTEPTGSASETMTLTSSILNHQYENGRRYHSYKAGMYMSPNDEQESDRLDLYHHIALLQLKGELHLTPLGEDFAGRVLDLGAGTGIWAMDMADRYPGATVIGVDLSPTQEKSVPPNCQFEVDDIEEPWTFQRPFDYIHSRWLAGAIRDWPRLVQQCYDHVAPGGWVEFKDWDYRARMPNGSLDLPDNHVKQWHDLMGELAEKSGATAKPVVGLKDLVIAKGFVNVRETVFQTPVGDWPKDPALKEIGRFNRLGIEEGLDAISLRLLTQLAGWSVLEAQALNANFRRQIREFPVYHNYHIVYGQKPPADSA